uniref:G-protein coupled receptors family 1 profile domain-containing protein n=2 Tax=Sus scrofa TaxID=9823 RepID=A0A8D2BI21_PIG
MTGNNFTEVTFLILSGFANHPETDSQLNTPMYFFLRNLAFIDIFHSSAVTTKALGNFQSKQKTISFIGCFQMCFVVGLVCSECFLLGSMAYGLCVAICNPLLCSVITSQKVCNCLGAMPYTVGFTSSLMSICVISSLAFGDTSINHLFCDTTALLALSCVDTFSTEVEIFVLAGFTLLSSLFIIIITYIVNVSAILKIKSVSGRQKTFSTCASQLMGVTIFYGSLVFTYLQPDNTPSLTQAQVASVFYTAVIPMLNPLIYILRNKYVKSALLRAIQRRHSA